MQGAGRVRGGESMGKVCLAGEERVMREMEKGSAREELITVREAMQGCRGERKTW